MSTATTIQVEITPEAKARIDELGMQHELELMLEHTKQAVLGVELIQVETWYDYEEPGPDHLSIMAWRPGVSRGFEDYQPISDWHRWLAEAFHPDVFQWFSFCLFYREEHGR